MPGGTVRGCVMIAPDVMRAASLRQLIDGIVRRAQLRGAVARGEVPCDFPHDTIVPGDAERVRCGYCPLCRAAV